MEKTKEEGTQWKVTEKDVFESIVFEQYHHMGAKTVVCLLILNSGFEVIGTSAPVDPETFDFAIGKTQAKKKAVDEVWKYLASVVQNNMAITKQQANMKAQQEELARQQAENKAKADSASGVKGETIDPPDSVNVSSLVDSVEPGSLKKV